jgi:PadR family transcriptional regulator PadR
MHDAFLANWVTQLRKGILDFSVLSALDGQPLYGYDIVRRLGALQVLVISEGTIYPLLSRLRKEGLLETYLKESTEGPARKYYRLTRQGKNVLAKMQKVWDEMIENIQ